MKMSWSRLQGPAKGLVLCVVILLAAGGACGLQLVILKVAGPNPNTLTSVFMITGLIQLLAMVLSAGGVVIMLVVCLIGWINSINTPPLDT